MTPEPAAVRWTQFTREREFPISGVIAVVAHVVVLTLFLAGVFRFLFEPTKKSFVEWEPVVIADPPGAGNSGHDSELKQGIPTAPEVTGAVERQPVRVASVKDEQVVQPTTPPPAPLEVTDIASTVSRTKPERTSLAPLLKGLPTGKSDKGDGGTGRGTGGIGKGTRGDGIGADDFARIRAKRQYRWTMLFSTRNAADYLNQLRALDVVLGVQDKDQSIRVIRNLSRRPALAERMDRPEDRIFWIDDDARSVAAMAEELQLDSVPWRVVAFFPNSIEQQLLEKELLYGKSFGRTSEDQIKETKFRIEFRTGQMRITVVEQR